MGSHEQLGKKKKTEKIRAMTLVTHSEPLLLQARGSRNIQHQGRVIEQEVPSCLLSIKGCHQFEISADLLKAY